MYNALTIAKWFVAWAEAEDADMSNLKLQKLLYYAQGHSLASTGQPLFSDTIQAWAHGPVVPSVYHEFKHWESGDVHLDDDDPFDFSDVDGEATDLLLRTWNTYGGYAAWRLRNMTHNESPWRETFDVGRRNATIPTEAMREHFASRTQRS
ncbi:Panacea domain-containing protein [Jatrophihabitans lederbergiae]|uniref:DUF4065 domain-containing protein n=1 Tax=Jatrophihabitans lederbergiae TaxID=3075547 RepID=A0ABU2JHC1_9ACTN|nr:type II toxin-antitoxin system antitoxin SocA domain-containing protein [Jatrophihabitans sp. DSM 44399]MDT0264380.1 DUF4065 domain-containing protein [Jatrophihabitans sp. DSM 44399]